MISFTHADVAAAFVGGAVIGGFLGALYGMGVAFTQRRWRRRRLPLARTMPLRRHPE
jgi:hypothetical protein